MPEQPKRFTRIHGVSEVRRLPRLGKIRLGIKKKTATGKEYPAEVSYFVCPPEVEAVYGATPTSLDVMIPVEDENFFFPQAYKWYAASHLKCKGDGQTAMRRAADLTEEQKKDMGPDLPKSPNDLVEVSCTCPLLNAKGGCSQHGNLMVLLPRVSMGGVYQIDTGSFHNIVNLNSAIDYIRSLMGRVALVPLLLKRMPQSIEYQGKKATHYLLSLEFKGNIESINRVRQNTGMILERVDGLALPAPDAPATAAPVPALPPPAAPVDDDEVPDSFEPVPGEPAAEPTIEPSHQSTEILVADVKKDGQKFLITTPTKALYVTASVDVANAALKAKMAKKPLHVFAGLEDGVVTILGIDTKRP